MKTSFIFVFPVSRSTFDPETRPQENGRNSCWLTLHKRNRWSLICSKIFIYSKLFVCLIFHRIEKFICLKFFWKINLNFFCSKRQFFLNAFELGAFNLLNIIFFEKAILVWKSLKCAVFETLSIRSHKPIDKTVVC